MYPLRMVQLALGLGLLATLIVLAVNACGEGQEQTDRPRPLPEDEKVLRPGEYRSEEFKPSFSFRVGKGWLNVPPEASDMLTISWAHETGGLGFTTFHEVYKPSKTGTPNVVEAPKDMVGWFQHHPYLRTSKPEPVKVGGVKGVHFDVVVEDLPEGYSGVCGQDCVDISSLRSDSQTNLGEGYKLRLTIFEDIKGETVGMGSLARAATSIGSRPRPEEGLSPKSVKYLHTTLHRALKQAVRWGLVPRNVAAAVDPPRAIAPQITPLSPAQARQLLQAAKGNRLEALYVLAVTTGMRQGEILGLGWGDVDLEAGTVRVRRTLTLAKGGPRLTEPKTRGSRRQIRLTASAMDTLERHRERQEAERAASNGSWANHALVFTTRIGTPIRRAKLHAECWKPLLRQAGLPDTRFHDLRHTCATLLLTKGVHPKIVSEMLGHSSISITLDTYSHVIEGLGEAAARAMEDALGDEKPVSEPQAQRASEAKENVNRVKMPLCLQLR